MKRLRTSEEESTFKQTGAIMSARSQKREKARSGGGGGEKNRETEPGRGEESTAKTTWFSETVGTSGLRGALCAPCVHGTPVFQSRDKDEARKGGLHRGLHEMRGRAGGGGKKKETLRAKEVRKPKLEGYRREGEYKARYASRGDTWRRG